jgi:hypothetical protein
MIDMYCKTSCDTWDDEMPWGSGNPGPRELFTYLNTNLQDNPDMGKRIWILAICMKSGFFVIDDFKIVWSFGESSVENVKRFLDEALEKNFLTKEEYDELLLQAQYARKTFADEYDICKLVEDPAWSLSPKELLSQRMENKAFFVNAIQGIQELNPDTKILTAGIDY